MKALVSPALAPPARRRRRTPRSPRFCAFPPRRYAAVTVSAVSGRPGKATGGHRKDARGMSIIGLSMAAHAEHNTLAEGGNRRWAETARQNSFQSRWPRADQNPFGHRDDERPP